MMAPSAVPFVNVGDWDVSAAIAPGKAWRKGKPCKTTCRKLSIGTQQVRVLSRQRLATTRNRVLRRVVARPPSKRTQGGCRPRD